MLFTLKMIATLWVLVHTTKAADDEGLRRALNEIGYKQRQLTPSYYVTANKDTAPREMQQSNDDRLIYLDSLPPRDAATREDVRYGYQKSGLPENSDLMADEDEIAGENNMGDDQEQERYLKNRLLEKLMLDYLLSEDENTAPVKRSFFREREEIASPEMLQSLYGANGDPQQEPSSFRERSKLKPRETSYGRLIESNDRDSFVEDYLTALNSLWQKYKDTSSSVGNVNPDNLTDEDIEDFIKYLNEKADRKKQLENYKSEESEYADSVPLEKRLSTPEVENSIEYLRKNPDVVEQLRPVYNKRYWLGSEEKLPYGGNYIGSDNREITIKKRSSGLSEGNKQLNVTGSAANSNRSEENQDQKKLGSTAKSEKTLQKKGKNLKKVDKNVAFNGGSVWKKPVNGSKQSAGQNETSYSVGKYDSDSSDKPLKIVKKSVDWSTYFGVDKRQITNKQPTKNKSDMLNQYIQSYVRQSVRNSAFNHRGRRAKSSAVDDDLKAAEDAIIDNVMKYTGAHEGMTDPKEVEQFKQTVIGQLAAAYKLEKLRKEMYEQKYGPSEYEEPEYPVRRITNNHDSHSDTKGKRVAVKKERADPRSEENEVTLSRKENTSSVNGGTGINFGRNSALLQKMKHASGYHGSMKKSNPFTNEVADTDCPVLNDVISKCYEVINLAGDHDNVFLPFCTIHQICDICGAGDEDYEESCDINFISQSITFCGEAPLCQYTARRILHTMHGLKKNFEVDTCDSCLAASLQKLLLQ